MAKIERGFAPEDLDDEYVREHAVGSGSWWSDPDATSSDPQPVSDDEGEDGSEEEEEEETEEEFNPTEHSVADVLAYVNTHPDQVDEVLAKEKASSDPRVTLVSKLEAMNAD